MYQIRITWLCAICSPTKANACHHSTPGLCCEQCCLRRDCKINLLPVSQVNSLNVSIHTSKHCTIGVPLSSVALVQCANPITNLARRAWQQSCHRPLDKVPRRFPSKPNADFTDLSTLAFFDAVILALSVRLHHMREWNLIKDGEEDKRIVALWKEQFQSQTHLKLQQGSIRLRWVINHNTILDIIFF